MAGPLAGLCYGAQIERVTTAHFDGQTHVTVHYDALPAAPKLFTLSEGDLRLVLDSPAGVSAALPASPLEGAGTVKRVRHAVRGEGTRLVLDLHAGTSLKTQSHKGLETVIILSGGDGVELDPQPAAQAVSINTAKAAAPRRLEQKSKLGVPIPRVKPSISAAVQRKPVIVIDPGHGGYDPGAVGGAGTHEKAVTLAAAKTLQNLLLKTGRYEAILTRNKDVYVVHDERVRIARMEDADLFISLHADSLEKRSTRGASVYTLADYARKRSTKLVNSQNWIMDVDLSKENNQVGDILVDLAQRKTFSNSDRFAEMLVPRLSKVTKILGNTHRRAGLAVLLAPDVPAVLLEMGFISNAQDEKALNSTSHRTKVMRSVVETVDAYFSE